MDGNLSLISQQLKALLRCALLCLCSFSLAALCCVQSQAAADTTAAAGMSIPEDQVLDVAGVFAEHPEIFSEVVQGLSAMKRDHNYPVYLVIYHHVLDSSLRERADELYESWLGELGRGMVIVYQLDPVAYGDNPALAYNKGDGFDFDVGDQSNPIPERDIAAMLSKIMPQLNGKGESQAIRLKSFVMSFGEEITRYHDIPVATWLDSENLTMIVVFSGFVILIPLIGILVRQLLLASSIRSNEKYYFPDVQVGLRLGAPYGGGWVSEKSFSQVSLESSNASPD